jgi:hypothetical protein
MIDPRIRLKNRFLAVILAWMLPGAGHFYQERRFKSVIYFCSIVGLWVMAMHLSEWKVMAAPFNERNERPPIIQVLKFGAQSGIGLPAVGAVVQRERANDDENDTVRLESPFEAEFVGNLIYRNDAESVDEEVTGKVTFEPAEGPFGRTLDGHFTRKTADGESIGIELNGSVSLGRPVDGDHRRSLTAQVTDENGNTLGDLRGTVPRSVWNWLFVPLNKQQETDLHRTLGKHHELATLLSVVAGLLNILAIFDAYGGPAYGYGDEEPQPSKDPAPAPA